MKNYRIFAVQYILIGGKTRLYAAGYFYACTLQTICGFVPPFGALMRPIADKVYCNGKGETVFHFRHNKHLSVMQYTEKNCLNGITTSQSNRVTCESGIQSFSFEGTHEVQVVMYNGEPHFIAVDMCNLLGLSNPTKSLYGLESDEHLTLPIVRSGQQRTVNVVNESGLYALIFQSRKPIARKFRKWVTSEVLPAIRKTGGYESEKYKLKAELWQAKYDSLKNAFDAVRIGYETMKQSYEWVKEDRDELRNFQHEVMKLVCKY